MLWKREKLNMRASINVISVFCGGKLLKPFGLSG